MIIGFLCSAEYQQVCLSFFFWVVLAADRRYSTKRPQPKMTWSMKKRKKVFMKKMELTERLKKFSLNNESRKRGLSRERKVELSHRG